MSIVQRFVFLSIGAAIGAGAVLLAQTARHPKAVLGTPVVGEEPALGTDLGRCYLASEREALPLFKVGDRTFAYGDLPTDAQTQWRRIEQDGFSRKTELFEATAVRAHLAKGVTPLPPLEELFGDRATVDDEELQRFFDANKQSFPKGTTLASVKSSLSAHLVAQKTLRALDEAKEQIRADKAFVALGGRPCPSPVVLGGSPLPALGNDEGLTEVIVAASYDCLECRVQWPRLEAAFEGRTDLRLVPAIPVRATDSAAAVMAAGVFCARQQGAERLAQFNRLAYRAPIDVFQEPKRLKELLIGPLAAEAMIAGPDFATCMDGNEAKAYVERMIGVTERLAVDRLPSLFVNGRQLLTASARPTDLADAARELFQAQPSN